MNKFITFFCFLFALLLFSHAKSQNLDIYYRQAYSGLCDMLNGSQQPDFKYAVFITENAWHEGGLSYEGFCETINNYKNFCLQIKENDSLLYVHNDREKVKVHAAVFRFMTDSIPVVINNATYYHLPFTYNFDTLENGDNWKNMFVSNLMQTGQGNCHSLPILYKLICEEMGQKAWLSFTPNHLYIKVQNRQNGWHNLELTSGISPVDGYMVIANYIHLDALRNAVYMDTLGLKQSIAMCLVDLAQGYRRKATNPDPAFILECCETALRYYPLFMNALLLKAEIMTQQYQSQTDKDSLLRREMENLYARIHQLGYRKWTKAGFEQKNPFEKFGYTPRMATVSNGRFAEAHDIRDTVEIGLVAFDVKRSKIVKFIEHDTLPPDLTTMFLSCDPMQDMYAWITPYHYCLNNPINAIDPDGRDVVILNAPKGAGGKGHMGGLIQDKQGNWHYITMGATDPTGSVSRMSTNGVAGGMIVSPLNTKDMNEAIKLAKGDVNNSEYTQELIFKTTPNMDAQIYKNALDKKENVNSGKELYNVLTNNCADAMKDIMESGTGVKMPSKIDPRPNSYFDKLKENKTRIQVELNFKKDVENMIKELKVKGAE